MRERPMPSGALRKTLAEKLTTGRVTGERVVRKVLRKKGKSETIPSEPRSSTTAELMKKDPSFAMTVYVARRIGTNSG